MIKCLNDGTKNHYANEEISELLEAYHDNTIMGSFEHENIQKTLIDVATNIIYSKIAKKIKTADIEDYRSQAKLEAYEALISYDPDKGSFINYLYSKSEWFNTEATIEKVSTLTTIGASQRKVLQAYKTASLQKYGTVTKEDVLEQSISYHTSKNLNLTREDAINLLKKNGEYKLIMKDLNHIIQIGEVSFDLTLQHDNETFENPKNPTSTNINESMEIDSLQGTLEKILTMVGDTDIKQTIVSGYYGVLNKVLGTFSIDDTIAETINFDKPLGYTILSKITNIPEEEVKQIIKESTNKIRSPHAHWVYLTENVNVEEPLQTSYKTKLSSIKPLVTPL